jgi:hypothetical protein
LSGFWQGRRLRVLTGEGDMPLPGATTQRGRLGRPPRRRCRITLTWPTFITRNRSPSNRQPTGACGKVRLS